MKKTIFTILLSPKLSDFLLKKNPKSESVLILLSLRKQ